MKIRFSHLISKISFLKDDTHDASHLTIFNQFRKDVENVHLKILKDFRWKIS